MTTKKRQLHHIRRAIRIKPPRAFGTDHKITYRDYTELTRKQRRGHFHFVFPTIKSSIPWVKLTEKEKLHALYKHVAFTTASATFLEIERNLETLRWTHQSTDHPHVIRIDYADAFKGVNLVSRFNWSYRIARNASVRIISTFFEDSDMKTLAWRFHWYSIYVSKQREDMALLMAFKPVEDPLLEVLLK